MITDTIVALATAPPPAARAILRLSGPLALPIAATIAGPLSERGQFPRDLHITPDLTVPGSVIVFPAPGSYTGQDVVELHLPGGPWLVRTLLSRLLDAGARPATAGEFTARAYLAGRLDLAAAEGVLAAVHAASERELIAARQLLAGRLSTPASTATDRITHVLALLEAGIDFSDQDVTFIAPADVATTAAEVAADLRRLLATTPALERLSAHPRITLAGAPNAGKSTLANALIGAARWITSPVAGTTRDAVSAPLHLRRGEALLTDTAGIDTAPDPLTAAMTAAAIAAIDSADVLVHVIDPHTPPAPLPRHPDLTVYTKADLTPAPPAPLGELHVCAITGTGIPALLDRLDALCFADPAAGEGLALNTRHRRCLTDAADALDRATLPAAAEFTALHLRDALDHLADIAGRVSPDDVLGRVFSTFCIGK